MDDENLLSDLELQRNSNVLNTLQSRNTATFNNITDLSSSPLPSDFNFISPQ